MKNKRLIYFLGFLLAASLLIASKGWTRSGPDTKGPVITNSFAVEKGPYGYVWRIYIEAEASDAEMVKIASVVEQPGYGHYPPDWIIIKPDQRKHLKGYIEWNTMSSVAPYLSEWTSIVLKVTIFDKAGNESNEVVFPFTFESGIKKPYQYTLPHPFDEGTLPRLGKVRIDLYDPLFMGGGDHQSN